MDPIYEEHIYISMIFFRISDIYLNLSIHQAQGGCVVDAEDVEARLCLNFNFIKVPTTDL